MLNSFGIIIQARVSSTRLPGKVLLPFYDGQTLLEILLNRLVDQKFSFPFIVATSYQFTDDPIAEYCTKRGIGCFRGDENDVLQRFIDAADYYGFRKIIRVCSDNPFLLPAYITVLAAEASRENDLDYISFHNSQGTPSIKTHWGLLTEYLTYDALIEVKRRTDETIYREHVTNYIYGNPEIFKVKLLPAPEVLFNRTDLRFTIDTQSDFEVCQSLYTALAKSNSLFSLKDLILLVDKSPDIKIKMQEGIQNFKK